MASTSAQSWLVCAVSDVVLIAAGISGIGVVVERAPTAVELVRWLGVAFLTAYGLMSLNRARRAEGLSAAGNGTTSMAGVIMRAAALTWINPHVYLDTVVLLGSLAATHGTRRPLVVRRRRSGRQPAVVRRAWATGPDAPTAC